MFTSTKIGMPFFILSTKSFDTPVVVGKWFVVSMSKTEIQNLRPLEVPLLQVVKTNALSGKPPIQTRVSNGAVQFYTKVTIGMRSNQGLLNFHSKQFSEIIDSSCLLNHLEHDLSLIQFPIRNAPEKRVAIWIAPRKYLMHNIYWKVVGVEAKYRKKKPKLEMVFDEGMSLHFNKNLSICDNKIKEAILDNPMLCKEVIDGFICSQTTINFIVYSPKYKWIAYLDKRKSQDNILGMWIQFQIPTGNGPKTVEHYWTTKPRVLMIPTHEYVMFRSEIEVPRRLESDESIWCHEMDLDVVDCHGLLRQCHYGSIVNATIGCTSQILESDSNISKITWEILHIDDQ